jgi:hypothetical protein
VTVEAPTLPRTDAGRRWLTTVAPLLMAGPVLFDLGYVLHPDLPNDAAAALEAVADVRTQHATAKLMVAFGGLLIIALVVTLRRWLTPGRGRALSTVAVALVAVGAACNSLSQAVYGYLLYWATAPGVDPAAGLAVLEATQDDGGPITLPVTFFSLPVYALGMVLLAAALWRAGSVPRWVPVGIVLAAAAGSVIMLGPLYLAVLVADVAVFGTALVCASRQVADRTSERTVVAR